MPDVVILSENPEWLPPIESALSGRGLSFRVEDLVSGAVDLDQDPAGSVYLNRMSASAHTRGHGGAIEATRAVLAWLESSGAAVVNGVRAFELELSKVRQLAALKPHGVRTPETTVVVSDDALIETAAAFADRFGWFIVKPNRGGKGLGVALHDSAASVRRAVEAGEIEWSPDGVMLVQRYINAPSRSIKRCEFVGGEFLYGIESDTSGGFELCPAEGCGDAADVDPQAKFSLAGDVDLGLVEQIKAVLKAQAIDVAGVEYVTDSDGVRWVYDINCNTNYSPAVEAEHGFDGCGAVAAMVTKMVAGRMMCMTSCA
ncbi:MAG: alpha-L-glutamate ligase [Planctomycetota bacterium]